MKFVAVDVETANPDMSSICSIGIAVFQSGNVMSEWYSLVDPKDYFCPANVSIHGIDKEAVRGAPTYQDVSDNINERLEDNVVVAHTHFDRVALQRASERRNVQQPRCNWIDSAMVARRTWVECARRGYGLSDVCRRIGYEFRHHNALEDAKASGQVLLAAMEKSGLDLSGMLERVQQPIVSTHGNSARARYRESIKRTGNLEGPLVGEVLVFTGALCVSRREAADLAAAAGAEVVPSSLW